MVNLQRLVRDIVFHRPSVKPVIRASSIVNDGEMLPAKHSSSEDMPDLTNCIEEDTCFAVYVEWAVRMKHCKGTIAFLNDTDTFFLTALQDSHSEARFQRIVETIWY